MSDYLDYTLNQTFRAPAVIVDGKGFSKFKLFPIGSRVKAYVPKEVNVNIPLVVSIDGFALPQRVLVEKIGEVSVPEGTVTVEKVPANLPKEWQNRLNAIKSTDIVGNIVNNARSSVNGMLIGAGIGAFVSIVSKKPFFASILVGGLGGGTIGYLFSSHGNKEKYLKSTTTEATENQNKK